MFNYFGGNVLLVTYFLKHVFPSLDSTGVALGSSENKPDSTFAHSGTDQQINSGIDF